MQKKVIWPNFQKLYDLDFLIKLVQQKTTKHQFKRACQSIQNSDKFIHRLQLVTESVLSTRNKLLSVDVHDSHTYEGILFYKVSIMSQVDKFF